MEKAPLGGSLPNYSRCEIASHPTLLEGVYSPGGGSMGLSSLGAL